MKEEFLNYFHDQQNEIIAVFDVHSSIKFLDNFIKFFEYSKNKIFMFGGDIFDESKENKKFEEKFFSFLKDLKNYNQIFAIPGNHDNKKIEKSLNEIGINIDKKRVKVVGSEFNVVGMGGSLKTPFSTPNERSEEEFNSILDLVDEKTIILSHSPPFGIFDEIEGENAGSKVLLRIINEKKPALFLCGHIHFWLGIKKINSTTIVKVPAAENGYIARIPTINKVKEEKDFIKKIDEIDNLFYSTIPELKDLNILTSPKETVKFQKVYHEKGKIINP
ncbi:MAG: metallophosphoesterase family protein [Candidatus Micrarchaeia archaeon]|jgi:Icc-related predicted phosphoesterase